MTDKTAAPSSDLPHINFFVMNDQYGNKEGHEDERIFHFYPRSLSVDQQINIVGLAQAIIGFTLNFSGRQLIKLLTFSLGYLKMFFDVFFCCESANFEANFNRKLKDVSLNL